MAEGFTWRDGERLIRFGAGVREEARALIEHARLSPYVLLTTERGATAVPALTEGAEEVVNVPAGKVDELSAEVLRGMLPAGRSPDAPSAEPGAAPPDASSAEPGGAPPDASSAEPGAAPPGDVGDRPALVAVGGGRVVDVAKAVAGATGRRCAAVPTTLSGAEMTPFHRLPAGVDGALMVRPVLVVADPALMASQPPAGLAASAMNALAHAMEALYVPLANPVAELAALRAAVLLTGGASDRASAAGPDRDGLALGALLAGYASGLTGIAVHHALCQSIVRGAGTSHAATNAVVLPHSARFMAGRAPGPMAALASALGDPDGDPEAAPGLLGRLAARSGHTRLSTLGVEEAQLPPIVAATLAHPALANTPRPPDEQELTELVRAAL